MDESPSGHSPQNRWVVLPIYPESKPPSAGQDGVLILLEMKDGELELAWSAKGRWKTKRG